LFLISKNYLSRLEINKGATEHQLPTSATPAAPSTRGGFRCASFRPGRLFGQAGIEIGEAKSHAFCPVSSFLR